MNIGRAIRFARIAKSFSQMDLANIVGTSPSYLSLIESGRKEPSFGMVREIADGLGVPEDVLFLTAIDYRAITANDVSALAALTEGFLVAAVNQAANDGANK
jgi:transcriptional regulator with XRE-family HTH domain